MQIEMRRTDAVVPYEHNPRLNDAAVDAVARSLSEFGFRQPIVVDADGVIIVGHTRWRAAGRRLLCGDSTKPADVDRLLGGERAALCATDLPYLVDYTGGRPDDSGKDWSGRYREVEIADAESFCTGVFTNILRVIAPHAAIYCWHAHKRQRLIAEVWERLGILDHQQIVWVKPTPVFGRVFWHVRREPCMMGWRRGSMPEHDSDHEYNSVREIDWEGKSRIVGNEHPTQKPVEIVARPMRKHTRPGDRCYEPFSGSSSQIIAAESLGRRCCAMELEPVFVDVAVRRWEKYSGRTARRYGPDGDELPGLASRSSRMRAFSWSALAWARRPAARSAPPLPPFLPPVAPPLAWASAPGLAAPPPPASAAVAAASAPRAPAGPRRRWALLMRTLRLVSVLTPTRPTCLSPCHFSAVIRTGTTPPPTLARYVPSILTSSFLIVCSLSKSSPPAPRGGRRPAAGARGGAHIEP